LAREWTPAHADNDARRFMTKRLIRDLWQAWREATLVVSPNVPLSSAGLPEAAK
jgi:hypothetical protein